VLLLRHSKAVIAGASRNLLGLLLLLDLLNLEHREILDDL
jgi:hypothetical protein